MLFLCLQHVCAYFRPVPTSEISVISISSRTRKRKMFLILVLMLAIISPQCTLGFSSALCLCLSHKCEPGFSLEEFKVVLRPKMTKK